MIPKKKIIKRGIISLQIYQLLSFSGSPTEVYEIWSIFLELLYRRSLKKGFPLKKKIKQNGKTMEKKKLA